MLDRSLPRQSAFPWLLLFALGLCLFSCQGVNAQEGFNWEYTPYQIRVWLAPENDSAIGAMQRERLVQDLTEMFELLGLSEFSASVEWMPKETNWTPGEPLSSLTTARLRAASKDILLADKLYLVQFGGLSPTHVSVAELDLHLRNWGDREAISVANDSLLAESIFQLIRRAFRPIVMLETPNEKLIWGRPRAIRLAVAPDSPVRIVENNILAPATRYNDRGGEPLEKDGIVPAEFTRLRVSQIKGDRVLCDVHSGMRNPFRRRAGVRSERYALLVKPRFPSTQLEVVKRTEGQEPLIDYEIYDKPITGDSEPILLGRTDFLGRIDVAVDPKAPLKLLYVKCGNQLLARLPIVPGETPTIRVPIGDDELRLQAEGFIIGMQSATMDAYARRLELSARFKRKLEAREFEKAEAMISEARLLPSRGQLMQILDQREASFTTSNPRVQKRIDILFGEARKLLTAYPDIDLTNQLTADLAKARSTPAPVEASGSATAPPDNPAKN